MPSCRICGREIGEEDRFCAACGAAVAARRRAGGGGRAGAGGRAAVPAPGTGRGYLPTSAARRAGDSVGGHLITIAGCLGLIAGPFLPWATSLLFGMSGIEYTDYRAMAFVMLGALGIVVSALSLNRRRDVLRWVPFLIGAAGLGLSIYYLVDLHSRLPHLVQELFSAWLGIGIFVCLAGSIAVLAGASAVALRRR